MVCTQCGGAVDAMAKFCGNCGAVLGGHPPAASVAVSPPNKAAERPKKNWLWIVGLMMFLTYAAGFFAASDHEDVTRIPQIGYACLFWTAVFFAVWWRRRGRKARYGALIGVPIGFLVYGLMAAVYGFVSANDTQQVVKSMVRAINAKGPQMVDAQTRLDRAEIGSRGELIYRSTLTGVSADTHDLAVVREDIRNGSTSKDLVSRKCADARLREMIDRRTSLTIVYSYVDRDGNDLGSIEINSAVCQAQVH